MTEPRAPYRVKRQKPALMPTEHGEQAAVVKWAKLHEGKWPELELLYSSLNGAKLAGGGRQWRRIEAEGGKKGVPDLFLPAARKGWHGLFVELKRPDGEVKAHQAEWLDKLTAQGYLAVACWGAQQAIDTLTEYLG